MTTDNHPVFTIQEACRYLAQAEAFEREDDLKKECIERYKSACHLLDIASAQIKARVKKLEG